MMGLSKHLGTALPEYPIDGVPTAFQDEWTWADLRTGAEAMNPFDYFKFRYYEKWLGGITQFFVDKGYVTEEELTAKVGGLTPATGAPKAAIDDQVIAYLRLGDSPRRDVAHPTFPVGSAVRIANPAADAHSRLPGYLRGRTGTVERVFEGDYAYFTHTGDGIGGPMPIYIVEFEPTDIWGPRAEAGPEKLYAELFEAYLAPIEEKS
jgi:nitrile hydratase beta subunit